MNKIIWFVWLAFLGQTTASLTKEEGVSLKQQFVEDQILMEQFFKDLVEEDKSESSNEGENSREAVNLSKDGDSSEEESSHLNRMNDVEKTAGERGLSSSKKIKRTRIRRDQSFKVPDSKIQAKKRKRLNLKDVQPPASTRLYYTGGSDEAELEKVINEEIKQLFELLKRDRNAELTLRLGSLYVEKARLISIKIQADYEKKMESYKTGSRKTKPYLNLKPAQVYNRKSLKLFEDFRRSYPKHKRMDEVLFFLGFNFYQLEDEKQGIKHFSELEERFPRSFYLYESRFQLGEHYFKLGQWKDSFKYYDKVARNKRGKFYFFALYKMAWSAYKMGKASQGLILLGKIIKMAREFKVVSDRDQVFTFTDEAVGDLVLFYTYSRHSPVRAKSFFLNLLDEERAWRLLKRLGYAYRDTSQTRGTLVLFEDLIKHNPVGERLLNTNIKWLKPCIILEKLQRL